MELKSAKNLNTPTLQPDQLILSRASSSSVISWENNQLFSPPLSFE